MDTLALYTMAQAAQLAVPVNATPTSTSSSGTATPSGGSNPGTETMDAVLGVYQVNLIAGRRYLALMNGLLGNLSVANDVYMINLRNSGSSATPTASSTLVAQQQWTSPSNGSAGRTGIPIAGSFIAPANGLNTIAMFAVRTVGTGSFTPVGTRELYVMYLGTV